jgi:RNA polymerase sigma-70 factor (ECF subfamily)
MQTKSIVGFNEIYTAFYKKSLLFVRSYLHDAAISEDIVSESLISLWEQSKISPIENTQAYLFRILKNNTLDYLRHVAIERKAWKKINEKLQRELEIRISLLEACEPNELLSEEIRQIYLNTLNALPEKTRLIFEMSRISGKSNKEIAEYYNLTVKGVDYHIALTLKLLKKRLKDYLPLFFFLLHP